MRTTERLKFIENKTTADLDELWQNCFDGQANLNHMNAHVPFALTHQRKLNSFLKDENGYCTWLVKRRVEGYIIGFAIHGNFILGLPNNIGFNIGLQYTRNGYATDTLDALIVHVKEIGLSQTFGHCFEANIASIRTMEKCGFDNLGRTGKEYGGNFEVKYGKQL